LPRFLLLWKERRIEARVPSISVTFHQDEGKRESMMNQYISDYKLSVLARFQGQMVSLCFKFKRRFDPNLLDVLHLFVLGDLLFVLSS